MIAALTSKRHLAFRRLVGFAFSVSPRFSLRVSRAFHQIRFCHLEIFPAANNASKPGRTRRVERFRATSTRRPSYRPHNAPTVRSSPPHESPAGRVTSSERISKAGNFPSIFWNYIQRWPLTRSFRTAPRAGHRGPRRWPENVARKGRRIRDARPRSPRSSAGARPTPARRTKRSVLVGGHRLAPVLWPIRRGRRGRRSPIPSQFPFLPTR